MNYLMDCSAFVFTPTTKGEILSTTNTPNVTVTTVTVKRYVERVINRLTFWFILQLQLMLSNSTFYYLKGTNFCGN